MGKLTSSQFVLQKREPMLAYKTYEYNFDVPMDGINTVRDTFSQSVEMLVKIDPYDLMVCTKQRAWSALDMLCNCFSAGNSVEELAEIYPAILRYWEEYGEHAEIFIRSESSAKDVAPLPLKDMDFSFANQLISFGIVLGYGSLLHRLQPVFDTNNPHRDALLERLLAPYVRNRGELPDECTRHLPYYKSIKIFDGSRDARPALMKEYLGDWYTASRREPYYNSNNRGDAFTGYWSWESAAVTYLLDIDDSSYRDAKFYPADLVEYARRINAPRASEQQSTEQELRVRSGQVCPRSGAWETLDIPLQKRNFKVGDVMQAKDAGYGMTVWRYIGTGASVAE